MKFLDFEKIFLKEVFLKKIYQKTKLQQKAGLLLWAYGKKIFYYQNIMLNHQRKLLKFHQSEEPLVFFFPKNK